MVWLSSLVSLAHLVGLALAVGAATVKLTLLFECRADVAFAAVYIKVARIITRQIILGMILLTLSGLGWLLLGYSLTPRLALKLVLVAAIWVMGPVIDHRVEPRFRQLVAAGETASSAFTRIRNQYVALELAATLMFYVIIVMWVWA